MKFAIKNLKDSIHTICRTSSGQKIQINPHDFIIFDTDNEREIGYWTSLRDSLQASLGIEVITSAPRIRQFEKKLMQNQTNPTKPANNMQYTDVSIVDGSVSPIAKQIAESVSAKEQFVETVDETSHDGDKPYTEEQLSQMTKEDLCLICDNFNIKYRKNSSVKTLVKLILESDKI
jgi:hypothetical protein